MTRVREIKPKVRIAISGKMCAGTCSYYYVKAGYQSGLQEYCQLFRRNIVAGTRCRKCLNCTGD